MLIIEECFGDKTYVNLHKPHFIHDMAWEEIECKIKSCQRMILKIQKVEASSYSLKRGQFYVS